MARSFSRDEQSFVLRETSYGQVSVSLFLRSELTSFDEPRSEGYDEYFDPPLESKYECPICLLGLREPVQTSCGHRFCKGCILRSIRDAGPKCPVDNEHLDDTQLYPDNFAKREMLQHDVFCRLKKQHGCPWKGPLCELEGHMKECDFVDINCPKNCGKQMKKKDLKEHLEKECPNRTVPCNYCKEEIRWNGLESHYETCPKHPLPCGTCGKEHFPRNMMEDHMDKKCQGKKIKYRFKTVGCTFKSETPKNPPPRRTRDGMEACPKEQASREGNMTDLATLCREQLNEIDELRRLIDALTSLVQRRCEEAHMRQERATQELTPRWNQGENGRNGTSQIEFSLPQLVRDFPWELQNNISNLLDPQKCSGKDWRLVASRLGFSWLIPKLELKANPTVELLRECTKTTTEEFLRILVDVDRGDVRDCILEFGNRNARLPEPGLPTQESPADGSSCSGLSHPSQESEDASSSGDGEMTSPEKKPQQESTSGDTTKEDEKGTETK